MAHELTIDRAMLTSLVRRTLQDKSAHVVDWRQQRVEGGFGAYGVYRVGAQVRMHRCQLIPNLGNHMPADPVGSATVVYGIM